MYYGSVRREANKISMLSIATGTLFELNLLIAAPDELGSYILQNAPVREDYH